MTIAEQLHNVEELPVNLEDVQVMMVPRISKPIPERAKLPRVPTAPETTPMSILQEHSTNP